MRKSLRHREILLAGGLLLLVAGCSARRIRLDCDAPAPVHLGEPMSIDGRRLAYEPIGEDYEAEVSFRAPPPGAVADEDGPAYQANYEYGQENVFERNGVKGSIYLGHYNGLLVLIPVWNCYLGVEGEVVRVSGPERETSGEDGEEEAR